MTSRTIDFFLRFFVCEGNCFTEITSNSPAVNEVADFSQCFSTVLSIDNYDTCFNLQ